MSNNTEENRSENNNNSVDCGDLLDISMVNEINQKLKDSLRSDNNISINVSNIQRIDTAGAQMLCAFYQDAKSKNIQCTWDNPSDVFVKSIVQLGLDGHLDISPASSAK